MTRGRRYLLVLALALGALGNVCSKPDWLAELEHSVDVAVPKLEAALAQLAADLPAAVAKLDAVVGKRLADLNAVLRDAVDGLNYVLAQDRDRLDAAVAARVAQLAAIARTVADDAHGVALGLTTRISATTSELLVSTRLAAQRLLAELGAQIARIEDEGTRVVADVYDETDDLIIRIVGIALIVLGLAGGAIVFVVQLKRRRAVTFGIQVGAVALVVGVGAALMLSAGLRRRFVTVAPVVIDRQVCPQALAGAVQYLGRYRARVTPEAVAEASEVLPAVASCLIMSGSEELATAATMRLAELRRLLGIEQPCITSAQCRTGDSCDAATGACARRCTASRDCDAGEVCHPSEHSCGAPCTGACPGGATCTSGSCVPSGRPGIGGGRGWSRVSACAGDATCIRILNGIAREAIKKL